MSFYTAAASFFSGSASASTYIGAASLGISAAGTYGAYSQGKKSLALQKESVASRNKANALDIRKQDLQAKRNRLSIMRESRIKRARAVGLAQSQTGGIGGSVRGAFGSTISQGSSQTAFLNQFVNLTGQQTMFLNQSANFTSGATSAAGKANIFSAVGGFGTTIFDRRQDLAGLIT